MRPVCDPTLDDARSRSAAPAASAASSPIDAFAIWAALASVPDPEIPVVSAVELGIVRGVRWDGGTLAVAITPTYSGCPAMEMIADAIVAALQRAGVRSVRIDTVLAPAWSSDWMAPEARRRLREYGIAPPGTRLSQAAGAAPLRFVRRADEAVACPRCGSKATALVSRFGSTSCKALYRCSSCGEPFDYFKPI